jgi:hypothetical protein
VQKRSQAKSLRSIPPITVVLGSSETLVARAAIDNSQRFPFQRDRPAHSMPAA